jgi:hypothetical protein
MQLVVDVDVGIETLYIDWQKYSADGKNGSQYKLMITQCN